jgi:chaperone required for assembly of F1-ATPase
MGGTLTEAFRLAPMPFRSLTRSSGSYAASFSRKREKEMRAMPDHPSANPMRAAQANMRPPLARRFYVLAGVAPQGTGFALTLDGKSARTPAKNPLVLSTRALAELIAQEWSGQGEAIDPILMPATRIANSAIDGVASNMSAVRDEIAGYAAADLVCYRAAEPEELASAQAAAFDPVVDWARQALGARFLLSEGIRHVAQPEAALAAVGAALAAIEDPFALAALHVATTLTGSALLVLAMSMGRLSAEEAWRAAHVDEDFQISRWGEDAEARARRNLRWQEMEAAARILAAAHRKE